MSSGLIDGKYRMRELMAAASALPAGEAKVEHPPSQPKA